MCRTDLKVTLSWPKLTFFLLSNHRMDIWETYVFYGNQGAS